MATDNDQQGGLDNPNISLGIGGAAANEATGEVPVEETQDGSLLVTLGESEEEGEDLDPVDKDEIENHYENLVDEVTEEELVEISKKVVDGVNNDEESRGDWLETIEKGMDLLGLQMEEKNSPFKGACSAQHPLLMESAVKFQSKASLEILPASGPVETNIFGDIDADREEQALRVKNHMNYQITEKMTEYYPDTEKALFYTAIAGSSFKKTYYDPYFERPVSEFIPADQFLVDNSISDLYRAERYTHILYKTKNEMNAAFAEGLYKKSESFPEVPGQAEHTEVQNKMHEIQGFQVDLGDGSEDGVYTLYEQHVEMYIESLEERDKGNEYELASPYVITVEATSGSVLGIRRNWKPNDDEKRRKVVKFTHYGFVPGLGYYNYGFLHLIGNLQMSLTSSLRSLVDSGQFANLQGGFKLKGVRIADSGDPIAPGEFRDIESAAQDINKALYPLPFKEPSQVLYQMLEFLDQKGQKFADSTEQVIQDSTNQGPVGTTMALLEASTKFYSAIHKRLHRAQKHELKTIAQINAETLPEDGLKYNVENRSMSVSRKDYDDHVDVVPVSDPNISSNAHRMTKAQTLLDMAQRTPEVHDMRAVMRRVYINMDYGDISDILPQPEEAQKQDPMSDIQSAINGKPIAAFEGQDHDSHVAIKQAFLQDPTTGGSDFMGQVQQVIQANIQEHMMMKFASQVQAQAQNSQQAMSQAAQRVAQMNQQRLEQQQQEKDQASQTLADAEMLDKKIDARKQKFEEQYKTAELELEKEKLDLDKSKLLADVQKNQEKLKQDVDKIVVTKTLDYMIEQMSEDIQNDMSQAVDKAQQ